MPCMTLKVPHTVEGLDIVGVVWLLLADTCWADAAMGRTEIVNSAK